MEKFDTDYSYKNTPILPKKTERNTVNIKSRKSDKKNEMKGTGISRKT